MSQKRSIFEEVDGSRQQAATPATGLIDAGRGGARRAVAIWLSVLFAMVVAMIVVGGLTRLTDSGLSITEWRPVTGSVPPLSAADWEAEFEKYRTIPEYQLVNKGMTLAEFKVIYWWEWGHRQLGRLVGLVWFLGLAWFLVRRQVPSGWTPRLVAIGALGLLQGAIGWWMVSSGLTGRMVDVASYRLATHLTLAFIILAIIAWSIWQLRREEMALFRARRDRESALVHWGSVLLALTFFQIILGALVAGIDAGRGYTDWPLMGGEFLPSESFGYEPVWSNFTENPALVQFNHRMIGYLLVLVAALVWWKARASAVLSIRRAFDWAALLVFGQMVLGIGTVLYAAPWQIAIIHQLGAVVVMVAVLRARFMASYPQVQSLR